MPHSGTTSGSATGRPARSVLADRYGRRAASGRRVVVIVVAGVLVIAALGWAAWVAFARAGNPVQWTAGSFATVDDGRAQVRFTVTTSPGHQVVCTVQAFNNGLTEVGRIDVTAGPSTSRQFDTVADVPTFELASSGRVRACVLR
jgi:hypothetical protein